MRGRAASWIRIASVALFVTVCAPTIVHAEVGQLRVMTDLEFLYSDIHIEDKDTGEETDSEFSYFKQKYNVTLDKELFPFLAFRAGGLFEKIDASTESSGEPDSGSEEQSLWLFSELNLTNPLYTGGLAYRRREFRFNPDNFAARRISREEFSGVFRWRPVSFPMTDLDIDSTRIWDDDDTRDTVVDRVVLKNRFDYRDFDYDYTYTRVDTDKRIENSGDLTQIHNVGANYTTLFLSDRLQVTGGVRYDYQIVDPTGGALLERRTTPFGSPFYLLDDTDPDTLTDVDADHPLTDVNIGEGAALIPVAVGLDFGPPTRVDVIHVLPKEDRGDSDLATPEQINSVADGFVWTVFKSDDQENWEEISVTDVEYDIIENRFKISFSPTADTPYIKVVTTPQPAALGEILILRVEGFVTIQLEPGERLEDFDQTYNLGLEWDVSSDTVVSYDGYFRRRETEPSGVDSNRITNGLSVQHSFEPWLFANARFLRTDITETTRDDIAQHSYSASLRADYLETLNQTFVFSGRYDTIGGDPDLSNSIFLRTDADLYEGWSANLDVGFSWRNPRLDVDNTSTTLRIASRVDPNRKLSFTMDYRVTYNTRSGEPSQTDQFARFQGFWVPLRTLSFFASVRLRHKRSEGEGLKVAQNYSANWSPFPDGLLKFSLAYNQTVDTQDNETRAFSPQIDWQITRNSLLTVRFNIGTLESDREKQDLKNVRATFRTFY